MDLSFLLEIKGQKGKNVRNNYLHYHIISSQKATTLSNNKVREASTEERYMLKGYCNFEKRLQSTIRLRKNAIRALLHHH
jgi:hypothetical protein